MALGHFTMAERAVATRRQRPRGSVTREAVVFAALAVLDRIGPEALTIRNVARQVGAPPMSLYTHFSTKQELLELMAGEISKHLYLDEGHPTWQAGLDALCRRVYEAFLAHPHWSPLLARGRPSLEAPLRERLLAMMVADGMQPEQAFRVLSSAVLSTTGFVTAEHTWRTAVATRAELPMREVFDMTLRSLICGYEALARVSRAATRSSP
jgi:AcrR family transcriptional regulator